MMLPCESIPIGELNPKARMLPAIAAICASEWRLGFLGYGVSSASFLCSIRCAMACEIMPHLPWLGWRNLPQVAPWAPAWRTASTLYDNPVVRFCTDSSAHESAG